MPVLGAAETGRSICNKRVGARVADQHQTGRRWRRAGAAQIAVFAGVPRHQAGRLLAGR